MTFTKEERKRMAALKSFAAINVVTLEDLKKMMARELPPIGNDDRFVTGAGDYRIVFSHEQQPAFQARHISVSNKFQKDMSKWMDGFDAILKEMGFEKPVTQNIVWDESYEGTIAVNVIEMTS